MHPSLSKSALTSIVLQKSKVAAPRFFSENKKRETIANSYILNRIAEVAGELDVRGRLPPTSLHERCAYGPQNF